MPIITVQRRMAEQGRIRLGHKITGTSKAGREYTRPAKLDRFRFTSPSERLIGQIAEIYGGTPQPWDNDGKPEFEVVSDAVSIPVIVVKGGFSQWHEFWTKGGCKHRCDGEKDAAGAYCNPDDPDHLAAIDKPTTRLSVMLSEVESLGVWRMESKGWNAAAELPSMAELAMHVGDMVPATLGLAERSSIIQADRGPQTSRYVVPYLDLHVTKQRLVEIVGNPAAPTAVAAATPAGELAAPQERAVESLPDYRELADAASTVEDVRAVWKQASSAGHLDDDLKSYLTEAGNTFTPAASGGERNAPPPPTPPTAPAAVPDAEGVVDAELVPDTTNADPAEVWNRILQTAASRGLGRLPDLEDDVATFLGGTTAGEADTAELQAYLDDLTTRPEVAA